MPVGLLMGWCKLEKCEGCLMERLSIMLKDCGWRSTYKSVGRNIGGVTNSIHDEWAGGKGIEARCEGVTGKKMQRVLTKLKGTAELQVEMVRVGWGGKDCAECTSGEVTNVKRFLMRCGTWDRERWVDEKMRKLVRFEEERGRSRVALVL